MLSQVVQAHLGLIYLITLNDSGMCSRTSEISSPIVRNFSPPHAAHLDSGSKITSSRGKCSGSFFLLALPFSLEPSSKVI